MPHGPIDSQTELYAQCGFDSNSEPTNVGYNVMKAGVTQQPASTNNPLVNGWRRPSAWFCERDRWSVSGGQVVWRWIPNPAYYSSAMGQLSGITYHEAQLLATLDPNLAQEVLRTTLSKMTEGSVQFNAFLIQGKDTLRLVDRLARGMAGGLDVFMTNEWSKPRHWKEFLATATNDAISNFSAKYLEYLYGWKPLADDVSNAFQLMFEGYTGPEQKRFRMAVKGYAGVKDVLTLKKSASMYYTPQWEWEQQLSVRRKVKLKLMYYFPSQAGEMLPTMTPFGTAWELAPWSFVIDWFIPIGDWIGAMEATQYAIYMDHAVLTQSVKVASQAGAMSRWTKKYSPTNHVIDSQSPVPRASGFSYRMTRDILSKVDVLDRISFPSFKNKLGLNQAAQSLALLQQVLNKWR